MAGFYEPLVTNNEPLYYVHINLEAQNDFNPGYPLLKRAVYYCGRMISSQYGTVFVKSHYEKIQKIWECKIVCVNRYCMNLLYAPYWGKQR